MNRVSAGKLQSLSVPFLTTIAATMAMVQFGIVWIAVCGTSPASMIALLSGLATGLVLAFHIQSRSGAPAGTRILLTVALLALSGMLNSVLDTSLTCGVFVTTAIGSFAPWAFVASGIVAATFSWMAATWLRTCCPAVDSASRATVCLAAAIGCVLPLVHSVIVFPISVSCGIVIVIAAAFSFRQFEQTGSTNTVHDSSLITLVSILGFGLYAHATIRMMNFLTPANITLLLLSIGLGLLVTAFTLNSVGRKLLQSPVVFFGSIVLTFVVPLCFNLLVNWNLHWNATIDSVTTVMFWRSIQLAALLSVAGIVGRNSMQQPTSSRGVSLSAIPVILLGICCGLIVTTAGISVAMQLYFGAVLLILPLIRHVRSADSCDHSKGNAEQQSSTPIRQLPLVPAMIFGAAGALVALTVSIDSGITSQKLFSARTANGLRLGLSMDVVEQSHSTRLLERFTGTTGDLTVWKTSAELVELRRNGVPAGFVSTNELTAPQPLAETLTAVLPLAMHLAPQHVLVLGDDSGVCTRVCCNSPIPFIEVVRNDNAVTEKFAGYAWNDLEVSPTEDERVTIRREAVATAIRRQRPAGQQFDVVISSSPNPVTLQCQEQLTTQFYSKVRSQLSADGVFCQRITQHDLGSAPILRILSSLSAVFPRVVVVQISAGEMAMIAGVNADSLLDSRLLDRLQRNHVTRELSRSGWDWSEVAALPVVDSNDPVGIYEHLPPASPVNSDSGFFALSLPLESARWGNKPHELQQTFAPHQQRLADAAPQGDAYREFAIRYSAVVQQMEILTTFHDQPWTYRKSLKTEMMRNSRPAVEKVVNGSIKQIGDPRDEYRKQYLITLGQAVQQAAEGFVDPLTLKKLCRFTETYEPLISLFAHHELIRIHETTAHPSPALELRHRLHTIFFADGRDYSVRQVVAAMNQILDSPELLPSPEARFDHLNAMLQELVRRWEGRRSFTPRSARQTQHNVDDCVRTANRAMDELEKLAADVDMSRRQFLARRQFITRALISPLRTYGEQVLAHRIKTEPPLEHLSPWNEDEQLPMLLKNSDSLTTN